jgi:hypothetical protein
MSILTPELVAFLEGPNSIMVASRDAALVPALARAVGVMCEPDGQHVVVMVPAEAGRLVLEQLTADGRVAVVTELSATHRTIQLKGQVVAIDLLPESKRPRVEAMAEAFFAQLELLGMPRTMTTRLVRWPCKAVRVRVEQVFEQSPGPGAGEPWKKPAQGQPGGGGAP